MQGRFSEKILVWRTLEENKSHYDRRLQIPHYHFKPLNLECSMPPHHITFFAYLIFIETGL